VKTNNILKAALVLILGATTVLTSCKKEAGPTGPQGAQGAQGPQGLQGTPGPAGSTVLSGNGIPTSTTGTNGDFYLDLSTSQFYGPKTASGWGTGFSMKGANGATGAAGTNGTNGNTILSGTVIPSLTDGKVGDYYLNTSNYILFGPKTATSWGVGKSLMGNANVLYSAWITMDANVGTSIGGLTNRSTQFISAPQMQTLNIANNGLVLVFTTGAPVNIDGGPVHQLPYTRDANTGVNGITRATTTFHYFQSTIYIETYTANNVFYYDPVLKYRYVLIPGGVAVANAHHIALTDIKGLAALFKVKL